ncbi:hypothetical protein [Haloferula sp. A504]|uniref:hypothetical protein n=1 Tax=Haloferula sp. A504 TaxID=3373601 RepID=UPI0031CBA689|nr:hypothetical protein [Verrucomicrobiaceae bacterium E54]
MTKALEASGCRIIRASEADHAPFKITFETRQGERAGIIAYAFFANAKLTRNRPEDEHRFQVKYGAKDGQLHQLWQDPFGLYTTLFLGINPEAGFFVAADPVLHSPTRMFISIEFKEEHARLVLRDGWHFWEREKSSKGYDSPVETMVGGTPDRFLDYVRFEQAALGLDQGHRYLLAERFSQGSRLTPSTIPTLSATPAGPHLHALSEEFEMTAGQILSLIESAPMLKMAVRGWVAESHLETELRSVPGIREVIRLESAGKPDFELKLERGPRVLVECKNVLRKRMADGTIRVDFQKTRASKADPCSRYYRPADFDVLAACLHPATENWEFRYRLTRDMPQHRKCPLRLDNRVRVGADWFPTFPEVITAL